MTFTDARNLLLGLAACQQTKDAPRIVALLSSAVANERVHTGDQSLPNDPIDIEGRPLSDHPLGSVLDHLLATHADGDIVDRDTGEPFDLSLVVPQTNGLLNATATVRLEGSDRRWDYQFHANNPDFDAAPRDQWDRLARTRIGDVAAVDFRQQTFIGPLVLFGLADFIAGKAPQMKPGEAEA